MTKTVKLGLAEGHTHVWNPDSERTGPSDGHSHTVKDPQSGWTDGGGIRNHKHKILLRMKLNKK